MSIIIPHRFKNRILPKKSQKIEFIIIGTFNPGTPIQKELTDTKKRQFDEIRKRPKFQRFNQVKNFYDRPQNRFWKIMDYLNTPDFYTAHEFKTKNIKGLKFYSGMERDEVFITQKEFCTNKNILIPIW